MRRSVALAAIVAAAGMTLGACGGPDITQARVDDAVGPAFAHLYARQQVLLGKGPILDPQTSADCRRNNSGQASTGAGNDWVCQLLLQVGGRPSSVYTYDLTVQANGCYSADGPQALIGGHVITTAAGETRDNPLFKISGCFDT